jgi:hypothetical protein
MKIPYIQPLMNQLNPFFNKEKSADICPIGGVNILRNGDFAYWISSAS